MHPSPYLPVMQAATATCSALGSWATIRHTLRSTPPNSGRQLSGTILAHVADSLLLLMPLRRTWLAPRCCRYHSGTRGWLLAVVDTTLAHVAGSSLLSIPLWHTWLAPCCCRYHSGTRGWLLAVVDTTLAHVASPSPSSIPLWHMWLTLVPLQLRYPGVVLGFGVQGVGFRV